MKKRVKYVLFFGITVSVLLILFMSGIWMNKDTSLITEETVPSSSSVSEHTEDEIEKVEEEEEEGEGGAEREKESLSEEIQAVVASIVDSARSLFIKQNLNIVAVGDSLTQGVGDESENGGYVGILEKMMHEAHPVATFEITNHGKRGRRTDHLIKRLQQDEDLNEALREADVILLTIGANDIMQIVRNNFQNLTYDVFQAEIDDYEERLQTLFYEIRERNEEASLYLIGVFNPFHMYFDYIPELNQIVNDWNDIGRKVVARDENATFIPIDDIFLQADETFYADDNFHPNQQGYAYIGERVFEYVKPAITEDVPPATEGERVENNDN